MTSSNTTRQKFARSVATADALSSDLESRAIEAAKTAETIAQFRKALGIPHDQAMALNERLKLNVPIVRANRKESTWERKPIPKPVGKQKGGAK